jgi:hypothetical protein
VVDGNVRRSPKFSLRAHLINVRKIIGQIKQYTNIQCHSERSNDRTDLYNARIQCVKEKQLSYVINLPPKIKFQLRFHLNLYLVVVQL